MLKSWSPETGEVVLNLQGACRGCPQSAVTLQESILKLGLLNLDPFQVIIVFFQSLKRKKQTQGGSCSNTDP